MYDEPMAGFIVFLVFGLVLAYFATQNTGVISLSFLDYTIPGVPAYAAIIGALAAGLFFSWVVATVRKITTGFIMRGKDNKISDSKKENAELLKKVHQLELENDQLKSESNTSGDDKSL